MSEPELPPAKAPPAWARWERMRDIFAYGSRCAVYRRGRITVLSSAMFAQFHGELRPQWHISISDKGRRPSNDIVEKALAHFDMRNGEEDNHHPGNARHFFRLCDAKPDDPVICECKEDEMVVVEPDGYTWSKQKETP